MRRSVFLLFICIVGSAFAQNIERTLATAGEQGNAPSQQTLNWLCTVKAFTKKYEALGVSRAEARLDAKNQCKAEYNEMHCNDVQCEGPSSGQPLGWTCQLSPFTKNFEAAASSRAEAKFKCQKLCRAEYSEMFCENPKCTEG